MNLEYRGYWYVKVFEAILEAGEAAEAIKEERKTKKEIICLSWGLNPRPPGQRFQSPLFYQLS